MIISFRLLNWLLSVIAAILEIIALIFLIKTLYTHCLLGGEYGISVWLLGYFLPAITAHTTILAVFRIFWCTVGLDPIAVAFNLVSGSICIIGSLTLLFSMLQHCGNEFAYMFFITGGCALIAGILQVANGVMCLILMPAKEAHFLKPKDMRKSLY